MASWFLRVVVLATLASAQYKRRRVKHARQYPGMMGAQPGMMGGGGMGMQPQYPGMMMMGAQPGFGIGMGPGMGMRREMTSPGMGMGAGMGMPGMGMGAGMGMPGMGMGAGMGMPGMGMGMPGMGMGMGMMKPPPPPPPTTPPPPTPSTTTTTKRPYGEMREGDRFMVRTKSGAWVQLEKDTSKKGAKYLKRADTFIDPQLTPDLIHWFHFPGDLKAKGLIPPSDLSL